jgi:hypothetical protein
MFNNRGLAPSDLHLSQLKTRLGTTRFVQVMTSLAVLGSRRAAAAQPLPGDASGAGSLEEQAAAAILKEDMQALGDAWTAAAPAIDTNYDATYAEPEIDEADFPYVAADEELVEPPQLPGAADSDAAGDFAVASSTPVTEADGPQPGGWGATLRGGQLLGLWLGS